MDWNYLLIPAKEDEIDQLYAEVMNMNTNMDSMRCPACTREIKRDKHQDQFVCSCGWRSKTCTGT